MQAQLVPEKYVPGEITVVESAARRPPQGGPGRLRRDHELREIPHFGRKLASRLNPFESIVLNILLEQQRQIRELLGNGKLAVRRAMPGKQGTLVVEIK